MICLIIQLIRAVRIWPVLFIVLFASHKALHAAQHYEADIEESQWSVRSSPIKCELVHTIPRYGEAQFVHSSGGELAFLMKVDQPPVKDSVAMLYSAPPNWKSHLVRRELSRLPLLKGETPVYFTRNVALRMLYELDKGMQPTVFYRDWADGTEDVSVTVSTIRFRDVWPEFVTCQSQLIPFGFDDVKNSGVLFDTGSARLDKDARELLDRIALYMKYDPAIKSIRITGHTDSIGFRYLNELLSKRRAKAVSKYLESQGVPRDKLNISHYGERRPQVSNASLSGRKLNRRVLVKLLR